MDGRPDTHVLKFDPTFMEAISAGDKRQTIRSIRRVAVRPGDRLILEGAGEARCREVHTVQITETHLRVDGARFCQSMAERFALREGFATAQDLRRFIRERYGLPFTGVLIKW